LAKRHSVDLKQPLARRRKSEEGQLFYAFDLDVAVPDDLI